MFKIEKYRAKLKKDLLKNKYVRYGVLGALIISTLFGLNPTFIEDFFSNGKILFTEDSGYQIKCIDGDTFEMNVDGKKEKIRLLAVDSPEDTKVKEKYGDEASKLTCDLLNDALEIELEYDPGNEYDKYGRSLYWVFVDDQLLQEKLVEQGLAEIKYVQKSTVNDLYLMQLEHAQNKAKKSELKIWE